MSKEVNAPRGVRALVIRMFAKSQYEAQLRAEQFEAAAEDFRGRYEAASLQLASVRSELDSLRKTVKTELSLLKAKNRDAGKLFVAAQAVADHAKRRPTKSEAEKRLIDALTTYKNGKLRTGMRRNGR